MDKTPECCQSDHMVLFLVIGSSLRSNGFDQAAAGMTFVADVKTKACYHLYSLDDKYAALIPVAEGDSTGVSVSGELVVISEAKLERIRASEPDGIVPGCVILDDGREVVGALGDIVVMRAKAIDITSFGSFAKYKASLTKLPEPSARSKL